MFDYATLKVIWWVLVGVLLIGFAIMDGHDMGVGALLPWVGRRDDERRVVINTVGPHWDGNQVWFITAGGAIFAAWPLVYATAFSGLYWALLAVLWALFFRPVGFDYRSKIADPRWRSTWDWGLFIGGAVPPIIFGVAFGNLFLGLPFQFDADLRSQYTGSFWQLLSPFALLCGVVSLSMLVLHGANYLSLRTEGELAERSRRAALVAGMLLILSFAAAGFWVAHLPGYLLTVSQDPNGLPDPMAKTVSVQAGAWLQVYSHLPWAKLVPGLSFVAIVVSMLAAALRRPGWAFVASALTAAGIISTAGISLFPFIMPSSTDLRSSLTVWDSVSSQGTLGIMLVAVVIFMPLIILYTSWAYRVMAGKVTLEFIRKHDKSAY
ncbi:MAG: cytochrome d ubiquinol oxidase subunit II [Pseudomonadales bacterium]|nr:cytochrome d ubiquinol oxidase subunit II [Pseudomonadales bacterium]